MSKPHMWEQKLIQNPFKHLKWIVLGKYLTAASSGLFLQNAAWCFHVSKIRVRDFWVFNNSLTENEEYVHPMKKLISDILNELINENFLDDQVKSEYLKYNIRKSIGESRNNFGKIP